MNPTPTPTQIQTWVESYEALDEYIREYFMKRYARSGYEWLEKYKIEEGRVHFQWLDSNDTRNWNDFPVNDLWEKM